MSVIVCEIVFGVLASVIVAWFSRQREYRADAGSANLMGSREPMIRALARLGGLEPGELPKAFKASGIRSEEHTSELPSLMRNSYAVFCLTKKNNHCNYTYQ